MQSPMSIGPSCEYLSGQLDAGDSFGSKTPGETYQGSRFIRSQIWRSISHRWRHPSSTKLGTP